MPAGPPVLCRLVERRGQLCLPIAARTSDGSPAGRRWAPRTDRAYLQVTVEPFLLRLQDPDAKLVSPHWPLTASGGFSTSVPLTGSTLGFGKPTFLPTTMNFTRPGCSSGSWSL